jgi:hypothetical protein
MDPVFSDEDYRFHEESERIRNQKIRDMELRAKELSAITEAKSISGELFDLTATSLNNEFGYDHNIGIIKYGINFPLNKFIIELTKILRGTISDKSDKRKTRLDFLQSCVGCDELEFFFKFFCNGLNGGGERVEGKWQAQQYHKNLMIITSAGGNIFIVFAQLIANMIDKSTNKRSKWDISDPNYNQITQKELDEEAKPLFKKEYSALTPDDKLKLSEIFNLLTPTNKLILTALENKIERHKEELYFNIVKYCILSRPDILERLYSVAKSPTTDFDWKLSANIHPSSFDFTKVTEVDVFISRLKRDISSLSIDSIRGFTLSRVKLDIDNTEYYQPKYKPKELNEFRQTCDSKFRRLYPQIMEDHYLDEVLPDSPCWIFLNYLKKKKDSIRDATQYTIDETTRFHLAGYYKKANRLGAEEEHGPQPTYMFPLVIPKPNSTEAIFSYISETAYDFNMYIKNWEQGRLLSGGAPAFIEGIVPDYTKVCYNFLSLTSILENENNLIPRLSADIITYFLNDPKFNTEKILDNLIERFNHKREQLTLKKSKCVMAPSQLLLVPTNARFNSSLKIIKDIINETRNSELGYPDGIRITINAIATQLEVSDNKDKAEEFIAEKIIKPNPLLASSYDIWPIKSPKNEVSEAGPSEVPPAEVPPAEVPPAEVPPAEVPPAEVPPAEFLLETYKEKKQKAESQLETYKEKKQKAEGYLKMKKLKTKKSKKTRRKYKQLRNQKSKKYKMQKSKKYRQYTLKK